MKIHGASSTTISCSFARISFCRPMSKAWAASSSSLSTSGLMYGIVFSDTGTTDFEWKKRPKADHGSWKLNDMFQAFIPAFSPVTVHRDA